MTSIAVYTSIRDERHILPFFLRHYSTIANFILVRDCGSIDGSQTMVRQFEKARLIQDRPYGIDEERRISDTLKVMEQFCGRVEWVVCVDADEIIIGDWEGALREANRLGCDAIKCSGWNMTCDGVPKDDGRQIYEINDMGVRAPVYGKPCIVRSCSRPKWTRGKHGIEGGNIRAILGDPKWKPVPPGQQEQIGVEGDGEPLALLHYRYLGPDYTAKRNARNYSRCVDKGVAWSCAPDYTGEGSAKWTTFAQAEQFHVMDRLAEIWQSINVT